MSVKINDGESNKLQITIPAKGETGWSSKVRDAFQAIGDHDHSGGGKGAQITAEGIADNAITPAKLSGDIQLSSLSDVEDTDQSAANLAGKILTYSNGAFRPLEFNSQNFTDIDTVINVNTQTELDAATYPRGSVVSVRNTTGTGYPSGAADFSSNTLDGITIVADYAVKTSIITNCTIICSDAVELAGLTTNCKVQSNNTLTLTSGNIINSDLHADTLVSSNSAAIEIQKSKGFFSDLNITNSNLDIQDTSVVEAKTITSLSGTPSAPAGTGPYQIVGAVVRKQKLPESASNNDVLIWNGSEWVASGNFRQVLSESGMSATADDFVMYNTDDDTLRYVDSSKIRIADDFVIKGNNVFSSHIFSYTFPLQTQGISGDNTGISTLDLSANTITLDHTILSDPVTLDLANNLYRVYLKEVHIYMNDGSGGDNYSAISYGNVGAPVGSSDYVCEPRTIIAPQNGHTPNLTSNTTGINGPRETLGTVLNSTAHSEFYIHSYNASASRYELKAHKPIEVTGGQIKHTFRVHNAYQGPTNGYLEGAYLRVYLCFVESSLRYKPNGTDD